MSGWGRGRSPSPQRDSRWRDRFDSRRERSRSRDRDWRHEEKNAAAAPSRAVGERFYGTAAPAPAGGLQGAAGSRDSRGIDIKPHWAKTAESGAAGAPAPAPAPSSDGRDRWRDGSNAFDGRGDRRWDTDDRHQRDGDRWRGQQDRAYPSRGAFGSSLYDRDRDRDWDRPRAQGREVEEREEAEGSGAAAAAAQRGSRDGTDLERGRWQMESAVGQKEQAAAVEDVEEEEEEEEEDEAAREARLLEESKRRRQAILAKYSSATGASQPSGLVLAEALSSSSATGQGAAAASREAAGAGTGMTAAGAVWRAVAQEGQAEAIAVAVPPSSSSLSSLSSSSSSSSLPASSPSPFLHRPPTQTPLQVIPLAPSSSSASAAGAGAPALPSAAPSTFPAMASSTLTAGLPSLPAGRQPASLPSAPSAMPSMFADDDDEELDGQQEELAVLQQRQAGGAAAAGAGPASSTTTAAAMQHLHKAEGSNMTLQDNWDDAEGYYKCRVGEVLLGRYEVLGSRGKGVFSNVLFCRDSKAMLQDQQGSAAGAAAAGGAGAAAASPEDDEAAVAAAAAGAITTASATFVRGSTGAMVKQHSALATGSSSHVAIKIIRSNDTMRRAGQKELELLRSLATADPSGRYHCVRLLHTFEHKQHLCLVFEPLNMNLKEVQTKFGKGVGISIAAVRSYARQILLALGLLSKLHIIHADIKPHNILANDSYSVIKLADFGSAFLEEDPDNLPTPLLVSRYYRAPEIILGYKHSPALDMWSVACCLAELYTGHPLFPGEDNNDMLWRMQCLRGRFPQRMVKFHQRQCETLPGIESHFDLEGRFRRTVQDPVTHAPVIKTVEPPLQPTEDLGAKLLAKRSADDDKRQVLLLKDLLEKMLALDPGKRISVREAMGHPFIRGGIAGGAAGAGGGGGGGRHLSEGGAGAHSATAGGAADAGGAGGR